MQKRNYIGNMSRREKRKKSKPSSFLKESKKRARIETNEKRSKETSNDVKKSESKEKLGGTWKSLPRPAKITASHSQNNVKDEEEEKKTRTRRSLFVPKQNH